MPIEIFLCLQNKLPGIISIFADKQLPDDIFPRAVINIRPPIDPPADPEQKIPNRPRVCIVSITGQYLHLSRDQVEQYRSQSDGWWEKESLDGCIGEILARGYHGEIGGSHGKNKIIIENCPHGYSV